MKKMSLSNELILETYREYKTNQKRQHVLALRACNEKFNTWTDDELLKVLDTSVSCFQKKGGHFLETIVEQGLKTEGIPFRSQVCINNDGIVVERHKAPIIIDFVFGNIELGSHISNYPVMSLKTSSRERAKEDGWTHSHPPKLFLYATLDSDYPQPDKFKETDTRKIVCAIAKKNDLRQYKLGFEHIAEEIRNCL